MVPAVICASQKNNELAKAKAQVTLGHFAQRLNDLAVIGGFSLIVPR